MLRGPLQIERAALCALEWLWLWFFRCLMLSTLRRRLLRFSTKKSLRLDGHTLSVSGAAISSSEHHSP
jgi:hypothetical protein